MLKLEKNNSNNKSCFKPKFKINVSIPKQQINDTFRE